MSRGYAIPGVLAYGPRDGMAISTRRSLNQIEGLLNALWDQTTEDTQREDEIRASLDDVAIMLAAVDREVAP